jgi:hypothetical protein
MLAVVMVSCDPSHLLCALYDYIWQPMQARLLRSCVGARGALTGVLLVTLLRAGESSTSRFSCGFCSVFSQHCCVCNDSQYIP